MAELTVWVLFSDARRRVLLARAQAAAAQAQANGGQQQGNGRYYVPSAADIEGGEGAGGQGQGQGVGGQSSYVSLFW